MRQPARLARVAGAMGALVAASMLVAPAFIPRRVATSSGPIRHSAYVWQRAWKPDVSRAVGESKDALTAFVVLAAEVSWEKKRPRPHLVDIDTDALKATGRPVGLAIRIGGFSGPFAEDDDVAGSLAALAVAVTRRAREAGLAPSELQLDFDCGERHLAGYGAWIRAVRASLRQDGADVPLTITALPAWMKRTTFRPLVRQTDGFVLQVHSVDRPSAGGKFTLCDPSRARQWAQQAARANVPFRVALPTYGYVAVFDGSGRLVTLAAETPALNVPAGSLRRRVMANPADMAQLVREWTRSRPAKMTGILWYRLAVRGDRLNWHPVTLRAVMAGRTPGAELKARAVKGSDGPVFDIELINTGDADAELPLTVAVRWSGARRIACDGLAGYEPSAGAGNEVQFHCADGPALDRLGPGETMKIGWVRLSADTEVEAHVDER